MEAVDARVAIIGGGFAGTALAVRLQATLPADARILLFEASSRTGPGLAYGTTDPSHLLNVPAGGMSLFPDRPAHFQEWLAGRPDAPEAPADGGPVFAPRALYGTYLEEQLAAALSRPGAKLEVLPHRVESVEPLLGGGFRLGADGRSWQVERVLLAVGGFASAEGEPPYLIGNPWSPQALEGLDPEEPVLLVGMGLTMVDMLLSLRRQGHRGKVIGISRHGWLPLSHVCGPFPKPWPVELPADAGPAAICRILRREAARAAEAGQPWQAVMDGARPQVQRIWQGWSPAQRAIFLRHGRTAWNLHRHRLAPAVATTVAEERDSGGLEVLRARLGTWRPEGNGVAATLRMAGGGQREVRAARIILCMGPDSASAWREVAPVPDLLQRGLARPDALGLGLEIASPDGTLRDAAGQPVPGLSAIGPLTRGNLWEITAVPEIRAQVALAS
ncbi:FAD dependent oxidoreductase [Acetobacteraceae bacterium AT-5844]|nr:FAD dependent oxidoreductase [Acetobacteraceae bacterium AT-5844]